MEKKEGGREGKEEGRRRVEEKWVGSWKEQRNGKQGNAGIKETNKRKKVEKKNNGEEKKE